VPRSLAKAQKRAEKEGWRYTVDQCFADVIEACAQPRPDDEEPSGLQGTWITPQMKAAYIALNRQGHAHSIEVWAPHDDGLHHELVGGLYGTCIRGVFAGESMFHRRANASKLAVLHLVERLKERGVKWIDIQVMTDHFEALGAHAVSRSEFLTLLKAEHKLARPCPFTRR
jgi:leucyl/phenylalanyl-tRNA--protein transferase